MKSCDACPVAPVLDRRDFVRHALAAGLSVAFVPGLGPRSDKAYPIPTADGVVIDKSESAIIARFDGRVYAFSLACPHQNTALRWEAKDRRFQCPKHKSRYRPDGSFIDGRATRGLDRFALRRDGEQIMVNFDVMYEEDKQVDAWKTAFIQLT